ncbi:MAG: MotE family protein [Hyphomicrobiales bacterium]|nr:MotE family protein [Hyphomicrobiales bacterium]
MNRNISRHGSVATALGFTFAIAAGASLAEEKVDHSLTTGSVKKPAALPISAAYCENIADAAEEARAAIRAKYLKKLEDRIEERMTALEAKRSDVEKWMKRRQEFIERAQRNLVEIYSAMRPEAAAQQISIMDDETAAAILLKLKPRTASAILNDIKPKRAARLAAVIAGSAKVHKAEDES